jgi:hypothetical protein
MIRDGYDQMTNLSQLIYNLNARVILVGPSIRMYMKINYNIVLPLYKNNSR